MYVDYKGIYTKGLKTMVDEGPPTEVISSIDYSKIFISEYLVVYQPQHKIYMIAS